MSNLNAIDKQMMAALKHSKLSRSQMGDIVTQVRKMGKIGLWPKKWCEYGQPSPEGVCFELFLGTKELKKIEELLKVERLDNFQVFKYGQPVPDLFRVVGQFR